MNKEPAIFLDSGAFPAYHRGIDINIQDYINFVKKFQRYFAYYANLDVIGDPAASYKNQQIMEAAGLRPIPCYHFGEDEKWLRKYIDGGHNYISLGGFMLVSNASDLIAWLDHIFSKHICDSTGMPVIKAHGFGLTAPYMLCRYPWYSVDSTTWSQITMCGAIVIPPKIKGEYKYDRPSIRVCVSNRTPYVRSSIAKDHINNLPRNQQKQVYDYLEYHSCVMGESSFRWEPEGFTKKDLAPDEKIIKCEINKKEGHVLVEKIIIAGVSNDYRARYYMAMGYFNDLQNSLPDWPWPFKSRLRRIIS